MTRMKDNEKSEKHAAAHPKKRSNNRGARRRSREFVIKGIYQWLISGADYASIDAMAREDESFESADAELYAELLEGVLSNFQDLEETYVPYIDREPKLLSPIERSILLLGTFELKNNPQTPYRVVINEAVELAKAFGGTDGYRYVNGVLDKLVPVLREFELKN